MLTVILWPGTHAQTSLTVSNGCIVSVPLVENGEAEAHEWETAPAIYRKRVGRKRVFKYKTGSVTEAPPYRKNFTFEWKKLEEDGDADVSPRP